MWTTSRQHRLVWWRRYRVAVAGKDVSLKPLPGQERILAIDVLRGVAVLGILVLNIRTFAQPGLSYFNPSVAGVESSIDTWVFWIVQLLGEQKFMSIFSMLFGAGVVLMAERVLAKGGAAKGMHYRRMGWLLLIGLVHAYFIWWGDILVSYALCGMIIYPLWRLAPGKQAVLGAVLLCLGAALWVGMGWSMQFMPADEFAALKQKLIVPTAAVLQDEADIMLGSYLDQLPHRIGEAIGAQTFLFLAYTLWRVCGLMLLGMALFKWGVLSARRSAGFYCTLIVLGGAAGIALTSWTLQANEAQEWGSMDIMFINAWPAYLGGVVTALAWIGLIMMVSRSASGPLVRMFAATGRMALTNYIMQSVLCSIVFYGWGLGLYGLLSYAEQFIVIGSIWVVQLIWSTWWLGRYRFGPLEWAWRSLVLKQRQPMARELAS